VGGEQVNGEGKGTEYGQCTLYTLPNKIMKPVEKVLGSGVRDKKNDGGDKLNQGTL
jgi:hypothetical protein